MLSVVPGQCFGYTAKNCCPRVLLGYAVIQLYAGECTPSECGFVQNIALSCDTVTEG